VAQEPVEQVATGRVGQRPEHQVVLVRHTSKIGDLMVTFKVCSEGARIIYSVLRSDGSGPPRVRHSPWAELSVGGLRMTSPTNTTAPVPAAAPVEEHSA
jgi:hypothetical protein